MKDISHRLLAALKVKKVLVVLMLFNVVFLLQLLYTPFEVSVFDSIPMRIYGLSHTNRKNKTILIWNSAQILDTAPFGLGHKPFIEHGCEISECIVFDNRSSLPLEQYDAILVHVHELWMTHMPDFNRQKHQRFVFLTQESPNSMHTIDVTNMGNLFNWTMSYKLNSDVPLLYGRILPGPTAPKTLEETHKMIEAMHLPSAKNYAVNKTRPVVWMASHCGTHSLRETYVKELSKFIPVDVYGGCGNFSCPHSSTNFVSDPKCYEMMETKYKFYLSFENSICNDYVTEKFFEIMNHNIVPVVYGGANYTQFAPHHSYINALDFTPEKLAQYLMLLDANDMFYNEYFWWKDHYRVESGVEQMARHGFCDLCKKLHQAEGVTKYYPQLVSEWHPKTQCRYFSSWETSASTAGMPNSVTPGNNKLYSANSNRIVNPQVLLDYLMNQLRPYGIVDSNETQAIASTTRSPSTSNMIPNPLDVDQFLNIEDFEGIVDQQQMQHLRDYVVDQLQPFGIVDVKS